MAKQPIRLFHHSLNIFIVIPLGFEPKTHSLEGCCSNPTELRNHQLIIAISKLASAKVQLFIETAKYFCKYLAVYAYLEANDPV